MFQTSRKSPDTNVEFNIRLLYYTGFPKLNESLHKCLDFGIQFDALCSQRTTQHEVPVSKATFAQLAAQEFKKCVAFVALLWHYVKG